MISVSICDDSRIFLEKLNREIAGSMTKFRIRHSIESFFTGREFLERHRENPFDVVFLDIKMPDMNGFQVAEEIRRISQKTIIIFVTTEDALVYDSFSFQPFDFIPKLSPDKSSVHKDYDFMSLRIERTVKRLLHRFTAAEKIGLDMPYGEKLYVKIEDIQLLRTAGNYVEYSIKEHEPVKVRRKLDEAMEELDATLFVRIHKSYGVNMGFIKNIDYSQLLITLKDGSMVTISRAHKKDVEAAYIEYLRNFGG